MGVHAAGEPHESPMFESSPVASAEPEGGAAVRPVRVVIADQHPLVLEGLAHVLAREAGIEIVERCQTGAALLSALRALRPDIAIFDVELPVPDGLEVLRVARQEGLQTTVILVTGKLRDDQVLEGVRLGIRGLVSKEGPVGTLLAAVRAVIDGGTSLDQSLVGRAMATMLTREAALRELSRSITARELDVVRLVAEGLTNRQIADRLFVSAGTLKVHLHHIYEKLHVTSREELIAHVRGKGLS